MGEDAKIAVEDPVVKIEYGDSRSRGGRVVVRGRW